MENAWWGSKTGNGGNPGKAGASVVPDRGEGLGSLSVGKGWVGLVYILEVNQQALLMNWV